MGETLSNPSYPQQQQEQQQQQPYSDASGNQLPLWAPYYGAPFTAAVKRFFKKYATFSGRASRSEYWWWMLVSTLVTFGLTALSGVLTAEAGAEPGTGNIIFVFLLLIWALGTIVPSIALTVRRLHDSNKSGWLYLLGLIPFVGGIILLILTVLPADPAGRQYDRPDY
jgi:uncharacterized membrane protein YhaH (DUF805 family)